MKHQFKVGIVGLGLIGGSIGVRHSRKERKYAC